jgi:hypothetical protein
MLPSSAPVRLGSAKPEAPPAYCRQCTPTASDQNVKITPMAGPDVAMSYLK